MTSHVLNNVLSIITIYFLFWITLPLGSVSPNMWAFRLFQIYCLILPAQMTGIGSAILTYTSLPPPIRISFPIASFPNHSYFSWGHSSLPIPLQLCLLHLSFLSSVFGIARGGAWWQSGAGSCWAVRSSLMFMFSLPSTCVAIWPQAQAI